jgi:hypothetical protein
MPKRYTSRKSKILLATSVACLLVIGILALELTNTTHFFHKEKQTSASSFTKGEPTGGTAKNNGALSDSGGSSVTTSPKGTTSSGSTRLIAPSGNFVSNHHPGENGSPTNEESVCNTTPGAQCSISFTKGSVTKSLPVKTADSGGATFWEWSPDSIGLSPGTWHVSATASLGAKTLSTKDATELEVAS